MAELLTVSVEVTKEGYELMEGVANFIGDVKNAMADGWQPGQDLPIILTSALANIATGLQGAEKVMDEPKEDFKAFKRGIALGLDKIADHFVPDQLAVSE